MDWSDTLNAFTYPCPCGDLFLITLQVGGVLQCRCAPSACQTAAATHTHNQTGACHRGGDCTVSIMFIVYYRHIQPRRLQYRRLGRGRAARRLTTATTAAGCCVMDCVIDCVFIDSHLMLLFHEMMCIIRCVMRNNIGSRAPTSSAPCCTATRVYAMHMPRVLLLRGTALWYAVWDDQKLQSTSPFSSFCGALLGR